MDAIKLLHQDHLNAAKVMGEIDASPAAGKQALFSALKRELEAHDDAEETVFYPAVLSHPKCSGFPSRDKHAHEAVESILARLAGMPTANADWAPSFKEMRDKLTAHIAEEETELFPKIREALSPAELESLGAKVLARKDVLLKKTALAS